MTAKVKDASSAALEAGLSAAYNTLVTHVTESEIWHLLGSDILRADDIRVITDRFLVAPGDYCTHLTRDDGSTVALVNKDKLLRFHDQGANIVIGDAWRYLPGLRLALSELSAQLGQRCRADIGISKGGAAAPAVHDRLWDQAILAVSGQQDWLVWTPPPDDPGELRFFTTEELSATSTLTSVSLVPPEVLFVPSRWPYTHTNGDLPSVVVVVGIGAKTTSPSGSRAVNDSRLWPTHDTDPFASVTFASSVSDASDLLVPSDCEIDDTIDSVKVRGRTYKLPAPLVGRLKDLSGEAFGADALVGGAGAVAGLQAVKRLIAFGIIRQVTPFHRSQDAQEIC